MFNKNIVFYLSLIIIFLSIFIISNIALAQFGLENFGSGSDNTFFSANRSAPQTVTRIISYIIGIIGVLLLVLIIYSGVLYATSAGSEEQIEKAKKTLTYSVIGIIIVALSFAITNYVIIGLFSDEDDWQSRTSQQQGNGGGNGNGGTARRSQELIEQGNNAINEGQEMVQRGEEMRERGEQLSEEGNEEAGRLLIDDGQELINRGNTRIEEGRELSEEGQATQEGDSDYSDTGSGGRRGTGAADVDIDCKWIGELCYLGGRLGQDCCSNLECEGGIADSGILWGACVHRD